MAVRAVSVLCLSDRNGLLIEEDRTIVYLNTLVGPRSTRPSEPYPSWSVVFTPDAALLFRFSALTFNAHRIHYDAENSAKTEGYPERVVHGPLQAVLLAWVAAERAPATLSAFQFRGTAPAFPGEDLRLSRTAPVDGGMALQITAPDGTATTIAHAMYQ